MCNVVATRKINGSVAIQVSTGNTIIFSSLLNSLNYTETVTLGGNSNLKVTIEGANETINVFLDDNTCTLCESQTTIMDEPPTVQQCACTAQQKCSSGTCIAIATNDINTNTVVIGFSGLVPQVSTYHFLQAF